MMTRIDTTQASGTDRVAASAAHLYDAECAMRIARQSHIDAWITAAADKLHTAVAEHLAAVADDAKAQGRTDREDS